MMLFGINERARWLVGERKRPRGFISHLNHIHVVINTLSVIDTPCSCDVILSWLPVDDYKIANETACVHKF